jgi:hypothetical protein
MRMMMLAAGAASLAGGGAYMGGAFERGEYYELAPAEVSEKLDHMQLPPEFEQALGNGLLQFRNIEATSEQVRWDLLFNGHGLAEITAELSPSGSGTYVSIAYQVAESSLATDLARDTPLDHEVIGDMVEIGFAEQVDSYLEDRPFNQDKVAGAMAWYVMANPTKMQAFVEEMDRMAPDSGAMPDYEDITRDYAQDAGRFDEGSFDEPLDSDWGA